MEADESDWGLLRFDRSAELCDRRPKCGGYFVERGGEACNASRCPRRLFNACVFAANGPHHHEHWGTV